ADPVSLVFVDEDDLVRVRDRLCTAGVLYVRAAIGEHQMRRGDAFLSALVPTYALAHHVPYRHRIGRQEGASVEVGHADASRSSRRSIQGRYFFPLRAAAWSAFERVSFSGWVMVL